MSILTRSLFTLALFALGCGGPSVVRGKVTDEAGTQQQGLVSGFGEVGGSGTVSSASKVELASVGANGALTVVASAQVQAGGRYEVELPEGHDRLIVRAVNGSGAFIASAIVEVGAAGSGAVTAPPMDTESSVEAEVFVEMVAQGTAVAEANTIDLRARINQKTAAEVRAATNRSAKLRALAEATISAQRAQLKEAAEAGITVTQKQLFDAQVQAAQALNVALDARTSASASTEAAYTSFYEGLEAAWSAKGADAQEQQEAQSAASVSFRATVEARGGGSADPMVDAAIRAAAVLEARASARALEAILVSANAASSVQSAAVSAGTTLRAEVAAATSAAACASAFAKFSAAIANDTSISTSVFGAHLGVTTGTEASAKAAVSATASASATLDDSLNATFGVLIDLIGLVNFNALATGTVNAYSEFETSVRAQSANLSAFGPKASSGVELLLVAEGSFRLN